LSSGAPDDLPNQEQRRSEDLVHMFQVWKADFLQKGELFVDGIVIPPMTTMEETMPLILLWVGIPVVLLGGGYFIVHTMH
jgi:hypothetical protein